MFEYFPENYTWSSAVLLSLMAGGQLGQIDHSLAPLREAARNGGKPDPHAWTAAWDSMASQQEAEAVVDADNGYHRSASARYLHAAIYHLTGERQTAPGPEKAASYASALSAFAKAIEHMPRPLERVEVDSPDGVLPGYLIPARSESPAPVVIFYSGFDVTKELLYGIVREELADRGVACLVIDTPGIGEPLRLRGVPSRPDYEVPTKAIVDYVQSRGDLDSERVGLLGISLGGYYAPRGAAYEHRIKAVAAWGGVWDYGAIWQRRWETRSKDTSVPFWQLPWVMGTETMEAAVERAKQWTLAEAMRHVTQPLLIVHGENDRNVPVDDARRAFEAASSTDKELRIFTIAEGGSEHVGADDPDPTRQLIADWFARKLGPEPAPA